MTLSLRTLSEFVLSCVFNEDVTSRQSKVKQYIMKVWNPSSSPSSLSSSSASSYFKLASTISVSVPVRTEISGVDTRSFLQSPEDKSTQKDFQRNYYISDTIQVHILCGRFLFKIFRNVLSCVLARQWQYSCHIIRTYKKFHLYWQYLCSHAIFLFKPIRKYPVQMHIQI